MDIKLNFRCVLGVQILYIESVLDWLKEYGWDVRWGYKENKASKNKY